MRTILLLLALYLSSCLSTIAPVPVDQPHPPVEERNEGPESPLVIVVIDVGQGDATLIKGPDGTSLLIDAGPPEASMKVLNQLEREKVSELDWIVLSHFDLDHIGGILPILESSPPPLGVIDRGDSTAQDHPIFFSYQEAAEGFRQTAQPGDEIPLGAEAVARVVVVNGRYLDGRTIHLNPDEENEASIGLLIEYRDFRYFTAGDLTGGGSPGGYETKDLEAVTGEIIGDLDILRLSHHGSETSTHEEFLEMTSPEAALISVGKDNDYHHPGEAVLRRLQNRQIAVYRTDERGSITITSDGLSFEISSER